MRLAHNPPSAALLEACDRLGIYVIEEAFDVWGMPKNPGDYSRHFHSHWKEDMLSFLQRDRSHPSVLMWFTGNEIPERGGLGGGYSLSHELADFIRLADPTRPITHGLCSYWAGLDDWTLLSRRQSISQLLENNAGNLQNENLPDEDTFWEDRCCTESFPAQMAPVWALTDKLPHVIGDFTWTSWDYIGEAGIGKSVFSGQKTPDFHPAAALNASPYPWRLANCGDSI